MLPSNCILEETDSSNPELASFLENVIWGTEGALYKLRDCDATLRHLPETRFLTLRENVRLVAMRMLIEKHPRRGPGTLQAFYHSMFSVTPDKKGKGYGRLLAQATLDRLIPRLGSKGLIYSHVECDNLRSLHIHEALGYRPIGKFFAMTFSRLFPKPSPRLVKLLPGEQPSVLEVLNRQYGTHSLTDFSLSFSPEDYYVVKEGETILAGVQALAQRWEIRSLGGFGGSVALHALPHVPLIRKLFNPKNFKFLKLGNLFFQEGRAAAAQELIEGLLAQEGQNTAMMFWDHGSPVYREFSLAGSFGFLNSLTQTPVQVMGFFHQFTESEISEIIDSPACISPIDL